MNGYLSRYSGIAAILLLALVGPASAQDYVRVPYPPYYVRVDPYPRNPLHLFWYNYNRNHNYDVANVIHAQGQYLNMMQEAAFKRELVHQQSLITRQKLIEQRQWEMERTPTREQIEEKNRREKFMRALGASVVAIHSGQALNDLLPGLELLAEQDLVSEDVLLAPAVLKRINVVGADGGDLSLLREGGKLTWPIGLDPAAQRKVSELLPKAVEQTKMGRLDPKLMNEIHNAAGRLDRFHEDLTGLSGSELKVLYAGKEFVGRLKYNLNTLQRPWAGQCLRANWSESETVGELVSYMNGHRLRFAKATPDDEAAYVSLHRAMVTFAKGARAEPDFRTRLSKPALDPLRRGGPDVAAGTDPQR